MAARPIASDLREVLSYDPETGALTFLSRPSRFQKYRNHKGSWGDSWDGKPAFTGLNHNGYHHGSILGHLCLAHRAIWALVYGEWPDGEIDHINGDRTDNRLCNLRLVDRIANGRNIARGSLNKSGVVGVCREGRTGKWLAYITDQGKHIRLLATRDFDKAVEARKSAEAKLGYHPNHGRAA